MASSMRKPADVFSLTAALANPSHSTFCVEDRFAEGGISMRIALKAVLGFDWNHEMDLSINRAVS